MQCRSLFRKEKECKLCSATARQDANLARVFLAEDSVHSSRSDIPLCIFCSQLTGARTPASTGSTTVMSKVWITLLCFCQANRQRWICWESDASGIEVEARSSNVTLPHKIGHRSPCLPCTPKSSGIGDMTWTQQKRCMKEVQKRIENSWRKVALQVAMLSGRSWRFIIGDTAKAIWPLPWWPSLHTWWPCEKIVHAQCFVVDFDSHLLCCTNTHIHPQYSWRAWTFYVLECPSWQGAEVKERLAELPRALTVPKFPHPKFIKIPIRKMCSVQLTADCQKHHALHFVQSFNHCCTCMFHSFPGLVSITLNSLFFVMGPKSTTARLWRWSTLYHWSMRTLTAKLSACFIAGAPVFIHGTSSQAASTASVASHFQAGPLGCFWQWQHTVYLMMRLNEQHGLHVWHVDHIPSQRPENRCLVFHAELQLLSSPGSLA